MEKVADMLFAAVNKSIVENIPQLVEPESRGKGYIRYGEDNLYPYYLWGLYNDCTTLKTIIEGTSDFVCGDDVRCNIQGFEKEVNRKGDTIRDIVKWISRDWLIYGGFALQIVRNKLGKISEVYYLDFRHVRSDKYNEGFFYSEDFDKKYNRTDKVLVYPKFIPENTEIPTSILYVKNTVSSTYPIPRYSGAIKSAEIERHIDEMHLNSLSNGFLGSYLINFLNGVPEDEQKSQIEKEIQEKFCGTSNAGRIVLNFADGKDNAATLEKLDVEDFSEKYKAAATRSREQLYAAFAAIPALFGIMTESKGFTQEEFEQAYRLYGRTVVKSIQRKLTETFDKIFGVNESVTIDVFTLDENKQENIVE